MVSRCDTGVSRFAHHLSAAEQQKIQSPFFLTFPPDPPDAIVDHSPTMSLTDTCRKSPIRVPSFSPFALFSPLLPFFLSLSLSLFVVAAGRRFSSEREEPAAGDLYRELKGFVDTSVVRSTFELPLDRSLFACVLAHDVRKDREFTPLCDGVTGVDRNTRLKIS